MPDTGKKILETMGRLFSGENVGAEQQPANPNSNCPTCGQTVDPDKFKEFQQSFNKSIGDGNK